jgi:hypothetical protein
VAPRLPPRYDIHVRLGRDGDIEEWLATDRSLDRPVLVRLLDPDATPSRRREFVGAVRAAAKAHHVHLAEVYAVDDGDQPYSILEWHGGVSIADRLRAGDAVPVDEYLPNAAGLASALAALHAAGAIHGAIDASAVGFSAAHPAKLGAFGRRGRGTAGGDTIALAGVLRTAITGSDVPQLRPSQVAEQLPRTVDDVIAAAEAGRIDAEALGSSLRATPFRPRPDARPQWTWRWAVFGSILVAVALLVSAAGMAIDVDPDSPFLYPAAPEAPRPSVPTTPAPPAPDPEDATIIPFTVAVYDPFGDRTERDEEVAALADGDTATAWQTERYFSPLGEIKPGVGVIAQPESDPTHVEITATPGSQVNIRWTEAPPAEFDEWEHIASGTVLTGSARFQLPPREGGVWLLWLSDLPEQEAGEWYATVAEVAFRS